jgi:hypothetical protein
MHKSATKCNETIGKWYKNKHGASKIIDTFETYHSPVYPCFCYLLSSYRKGSERDLNFLDHNFFGKAMGINENIDPLNGTLFVDLRIKGILG